MLLVRRAELGMDEASIAAAARDLRDAIAASIDASGAPHIVVVCPSAGAPASDEAFAESLRGVSGIDVIAPSNVFEHYPVANIHDAFSEREGHVTFTEEYFAALGTKVARRIRVLGTQPKKVLLVDCDDTVWGGLCGELGADGVVIDAPRLALQRYLLAQRALGVLLCAVSKNNEADALAVFDRKDMLVRREHLTSFRINWSPKSENIADIARELDLGVDSFVLLDDDAYSDALDWKVGVEDQVTRHLHVVPVGLDLPSPTLHRAAVRLAQLAEEQHALTLQSRATIQASRARLTGLRGADGFYTSRSTWRSRMKSAHEEIERRVAEAREIARSIEGTGGVIGAFLHGSSVRPYGGEGSDLDLAVLVDDEAPPAAAGAAHQKLWKDGLKIADISFYKRTVFATPRVDMEHFRAAQARVLFDRDGVVASLRAEVATLPPALAATRMRVHYFEVVSLAGKVSAAQARGKLAAVKLLAAQLVHAAGRLLCLAANAWPAPMTWMFEELELSGTPEPLVTALRSILDEPQPKALRILRGMLDGYSCSEARCSSVIRSRSSTGSTRPRTVLRPLLGGGLVVS